MADTKLYLFRKLFRHSRAIWCRCRLDCCCIPFDRREEYTNGALSFLPRSFHNGARDAQSASGVVTMQAAYRSATYPWTRGKAGACTEACRRNVEFQSVSFTGYGYFCFRPEPKYRGGRRENSPRSRLREHCASLFFRWRNAITGRTSAAEAG